MFVDGSLGVHRIWWFLQCSHLMCSLVLTAASVPHHGGNMSLLASHCGFRVVPLAAGWYQGPRALLHMSPNLQPSLSLVFVGVVLGECSALLQGGGGLSAKCEVMGFCLKLATSKKGGVYPFCAQLNHSKMRRGGLPRMCRSVYLCIFWGCKRKLGGLLPQK